MAVRVKTVRVHNPGKRKAKRKMSAKQIKFFGTPRQKAALKSSKRRVAPARRKPVAKRRAVTKRRKNVGEIVSIALAGLGNPGKKRTTKKRTINTMAKRRKARKATAGTKRVARRRVRRTTNPGTHRRKRSTHKIVARRRRNPMYRVRRVGRRRNAGVSALSSGMLGKAIAVIAGAVGSKYVTQLALGGNNTGIMGYAGNAVATIGLGWAAKKVLKSEEFGNSVMLGGLVALTLRVIQDQTPLGNFVNLSLNGAGKGGDYSLGMIQNSSFFVPQVNVDGSMNTFATPRATRDYVARQQAAAVAANPGKTGVSGLGNPGGNNTTMINRNRRAIM